MHRESISAKNFIGLKPQMFSPANLSTFTVSRRLKEELGWATDKQLRLFINIVLFKTVIPLRI